LLAFAASSIFTAALVPWLRSLKTRKDVRVDTPDSHQTKVGTPSMGGTAIVLGITLAALCIAHSREVLFIALLTLFFGMIGFLDDFTKATGRDNRGLRAREKLILQGVGCLLFYWLLGRESESAGVVALPWSACVIIGTSNASNIADGLDGLAAGLTCLVAASLGCIAAARGEYAIAVFAAAMAGATAGFLLFNTRKAQIFMGDTGSLALGAGLAVCALALRCELLLPFICLPFVIDAMSVVLQVGCFKTTGKRIFRMAPIHHGFELSGWLEWRVVIIFWLAGLASGVGTLYVWKTALGQSSASLL